MRTISLHAGRKGKDECPIHLNGLGIRGVQSRIAKVPIRVQAEPCDIDGWIVEISRAWQHGPENTLELARLLHRARQSMAHGQWSRLWRSRRLPFSKRKAEMLVNIGQRLGGTNAQTFARLPAGWNTLYYIAQLGQELAERLIAEGRIHPRLRLREARELLAEFLPELAPKGPTPTPLMRRLARFSEFVKTHEANWSHTERQLFRVELGRFLKLVPLNPNKLMNNPNSHERITSL